MDACQKNEAVGKVCRLGEDQKYTAGQNRSDIIILTTKTEAERRVREGV